MMRALVLLTLALARALNDCSHITCRHEVHQCTAFSFDTSASDACHAQWQACKAARCWRDHSSEAYKKLFACDDAYRVAQGGWHAPAHSTIIHQVMMAHSTGTVDGFADECDGKKSHSSIRVFHHKDEATCSQHGPASKFITEPGAFLQARKSSTYSSIFVKLNTPSSSSAKGACEELQCR